MSSVCHLDSGYTFFNRKEVQIESETNALGCEVVSGTEFIHSAVYNEHPINGTNGARTTSESGFR